MESKKGHWIQTDSLLNCAHKEPDDRDDETLGYFDLFFFTCSECNEEVCLYGDDWGVSGNTPYEFCPRCGAEMKKEESTHDE